MRDGDETECMLERLEEDALDRDQHRGLGSEKGGFGAGGFVPPCWSKRDEKEVSERENDTESNPVGLNISTSEPATVQDMVMVMF